MPQLKLKLPLSMQSVPVHPELKHFSLSFFFFPLNILQYSDIFYLKALVLLKVEDLDWKAWFANRKRNKNTPEVDMQKCKWL